MARRRTSSRSSIVEVSKVAGVSIATVSRVLNGHPHVSDDAVSAVQAAIERTGYRGGAAAAARHRSSMAPGGRTGNIAVLFPDANQEALRTPLSGRLLHGIDGELRRHGFTMIVTGLEPDLTPPAAIAQRKVDGMIIRGSRLAAELHGILPALPSVWVFEAGYQSGFQADMICEDNPQIGMMAARRLQAHSHRRLCVMNFEPDHASLRVRRMFFVEEAEQLGLPVRVFTAARDRTAAVLDEFAAMKPAQRPTGLFIPGTDSVVIDVCRGLEARGLRIGSDVELLSVNNDVNLLWAMNPSLANIDIHPEQIGRAAVDTLLWRLARPAEATRRRIIVEPSIVEGRAAATPAIPASRK